MATCLQQAKSLLQVRKRQTSNGDMSAAGKKPATGPKGADLEWLSVCSRQNACYSIRI
ncbi:hypothetical protein MU1_44080 [Paenibacillus glycanilyticus]|uniref:Uncharacterized protein n=1 Tax=Paenibacillus glycanilyticus TaxID=126569 RepID=A0ABQ6GH90_9BACL|nr:hypothetical protein MU1_44080 [Paenibacillus glycanilyticus]